MLKANDLEKIVEENNDWIMIDTEEQGGGGSAILIRYNVDNDEYEVDVYCVDRGVYSYCQNLITYNLMTEVVEALTRFPEVMAEEIDYTPGDQINFA